MGAALEDLEEMKEEGVQPSALPTVLKKPAEYPPVNAPWNRRRPWSSVTSCVVFFFGRGERGRGGLSIARRNG
jgi:hypothetical protein